LEKRGPIIDRLDADEIKEDGPLRGELDLIDSKIDGKV
jgi:hypothetical protein